MLEASAVATAIPSLWSAINSWFTPAVLFLLLNLMIATIALTSSLTPTQPPHDRDQHREPPSSDEKSPPPVSILDRVKSLGLFPSSSPGKAPPQRQPSPLIPPEELYAETHASPQDPFEERGLEGAGSRSPVGKFEAFDLYGYLHGEEPATGIPRESGPAHYIFEPTHPQEVLLPPERDEKAVEGVEEEEAGEAEEEVDVAEEEETRVEDESEEEEEEERETETETETGAEAELPSLLLRRGIRRSESLNVRFSFVNVGEEEGEGGAKEAGDAVAAESVERRRPGTTREGKGKWGGDEEGEVDARADDFINRFKQQLKMQRMDSLAKLKDAAAISKLKSF